MGTGCAWGPECFSVSLCFLTFSIKKIFVDIGSKNQKTIFMPPTWSSEGCVKLCSVALWPGTVLCPKGSPSSDCLRLRALQSMHTLSFLICEMGIKVDVKTKWDLGGGESLEIMNCT